MEQFAAFTDRLLADLDLILLGQDTSYAYWAERQNGEPTLVAAPIAVGELLQETLFKQTPSVILTSATLSTNQSFDYIESQLGLSGASGLILGSPFAYDKQAVLCVPREAKHPNHPRYAHYVAYPSYPAPCPGGVLALFTSYSLMDEWPMQLSKARATSPLSKATVLSRTRQDFRSCALYFWHQCFWKDDFQARHPCRRDNACPLPSPDRPVTRAPPSAIEDAGGTRFLSAVPRPFFDSSKAGANPYEVALAVWSSG